MSKSLIYRIFLPLVVIALFLLFNIDTFFHDHERFNNELLREDYTKSFNGKIIHITYERNRPSVKKLILSSKESFSLSRSIENEFELNDSITKKANDYEINIYKSDTLFKIIYLNKIE